MTIRPVKTITKSKYTVEGAGVNLHRVFGYDELNLLDPFLMMDDFRSDNPRDYLNGFPWHPHRGIETITYILKGTIDHADSLGNKGELSDGDIQWMTAGSGIIHQEMPKGNQKGEMHGFQLWANLPSDKKMTKPRYQDIQSEAINEIKDDDGSSIKIIAGNYRGYFGPVDGISTKPNYLDISIPPLTSKRIPFDTRRQGFAYVFEGNANFSNSSKPMGIQIEKEFNGEEIKLRDMTGNRTLLTFDSGDEIQVKSGESGVRFLLISGLPIKEPVAWHGPIVMNTKEELKQAIQELNNGNFIKTNMNES